jgi:hypothetical protein
MVQLNKYINFGSFAIRDKMTIRHQKPNNLFSFLSWSLYLIVRLRECPPLQKVET